MSFLRFWPGRSEKASSKVTIDPDRLGVDLYAQLTYMTAISEAGVSRSQLFGHASGLPYTPSKYFAQVHFLASQLHYDYAQACRVVGQGIKEEEMRGLLLRFSGSLSSGESETEFLEREANAQAEAYASQYERDVETLKKWTDAYVAMVVAGVIVVMVSVVSMLMFDFGLFFLMFLVGTMVTVTILSAWLIYRVAPHESKTHSLRRRSAEQMRARAMLRILLPMGIVASGAAFALGASMGWLLIVLSAFIFPVGALMRRDDQKIDLRDKDIPAVVRALGGVTSAVGTTVTDALEKIDQRSMGNLSPDIFRLRARLLAGISPDLCWQRFVAESGSEMVHRTVQMFWDGIQLGGEPERIGLSSSLYSMRVSLLRAKRKLIASTFTWLVIPLHIALTGLMVFILQVMDIFQATLASIGDVDVSQTSTAITATPFSSFNAHGTSIFVWLITLVILVLTVANAYAPKAAEGGHNLKLLYNLGIMGIISGANLLLVPQFVQFVFRNVSVV